MKSLCLGLLILSFLAIPVWADNCSVNTPVCLLANNIKSDVENSGADTKDPIRKKHIECGNEHTDTRGMEKCDDAAIKEYREALKTIYQTALDSVDKDAKVSLRNSQDQWLKYYDAEITAKRRSQALVQGTLIPLLLGNEEEQLIRQRIAQLTFYVDWGTKKSDPEK